MPLQAGVALRRAGKIHYYDTGEQQDLIGDFIRETVIPAEYGCTFGADCPPCALKSADHIVDIGDATQFTIMDIIIAVQD